MHENGMRPVHPGEVLNNEYLQPLAVTPGELARALHVPPSSIHALIDQRHGIDAELAIRLATALGTSAHFWLNVHNQYELRMAEIANGDTIRKQVHPIDFHT